MSADMAAGGEEDFWGNVGAYIRFFFTVLLGTANVASQPFRKVNCVDVLLPVSICLPAWVQLCVVGAAAHWQWTCMHAGPMGLHATAAACAGNCNPVH